MHTIKSLAPKGFNEKLLLSGGHLLWLVMPVAKISVLDRIKLNHIGMYAKKSPVSFHLGSTTRRCYGK